MSTPIPTPNWVRTAMYERTVDGDTVWALVSLGYDVHTRHSIRLAGVNAPALSELGGPEAHAFTVDWFTENVPDGAFTLVSRKEEKYGRYLGTVIAPNGRCLNDDLLSSGNAVPDNP